jgi:hypothetical protein
MTTNQEVKGIRVVVLDRLGKIDNDKLLAIEQQVPATKISMHEFTALIELQGYISVYEEGDDDSWTQEYVHPKQYRRIACRARPS